MAPQNSVGGPAFLLAQIGAHASQRFAERLSPLGLTPAHAGILRILGRQPDITQRALAELLGVFPSRLVILLDELAQRRLVERRPSPNDRRMHALRLTTTGREQLEAVGRMARQHQDELCGGLSGAEREQLRELLAKVAAHQGLTPGVHPGYRRKQP